MSRDLGSIGAALRSAATLAVATGLALVPATARAASPALLQSPYHVSAVCVFAPTGGTPWVVTGVAVAFATNGATPLTTLVECLQNGVPVLTAPGPGPVAVGGAVLTQVPPPDLTACGVAFFSDGGLVSTCPWGAAAGV
jgi:hypothetical protein